MTFRLVNGPGVKKNIVNATGYYKEISIELAHQFLFRIREAEYHIKHYPFAFEIRYKKVRTLSRIKFII